MIREEKVIRNDIGYWFHSKFPEWEEYDEYVPKEVVKKFFDDNNLEYSFFWFEDNAPEELVEEYFEEGSPEVMAKWDISNILPDKWFPFGIYETEDGPVLLGVVQKESD